MKRSWSTSVFPIAALFSFRMLGLFMLIPVFTIYAANLTGATPTLIGIALGSYGLSQGLLQMPFGYLSDRFGRKRLIAVGLILFAVGSLVGALTTSIYGMILARILQGTGAIGSVLIALLADLTPDSTRTKAMAIIGVTIGLSFSLAMIISPALTHYWGLPGIFYCTLFLALLGLVLLFNIIPTPQKEPFHLDTEVNFKLIQKVIRNPHLLRLNLSIFCQHFLLTATFFSLPLLLQKQIHQGNLATTWHFYLPMMIFSFLAMVPPLIWGEKKQQLKGLFIGSLAVIVGSQLLLAFFSASWLLLCILVFCYFVAFNLLEASLPTLVSRQAPLESKGTAMGVYSTCQFLGIFFGGVLAGIIFSHWGSQGVFIGNGLLALIWLGIAYAIQPNLYELTLLLPYPPDTPNLASLTAQLSALAGVRQIIPSPEERTFYLRINKMHYQEGSAEKLIQNLNKSSA